MGFSKNIKALRKRHRNTQADMAKVLDIGRGRWAKYEEGRAEPPLDLLRRIAEHFDVSLDRLLDHKVNGEEIRAQKALPQEGGTEIEVIPGTAMAGYLSGYEDPEYLESLDKIRIPYFPSGKLRAFPVSGDSMYPLADGSYVIGRYLEGREQIKDGKTYVVVSRNEGISYKRVWNDLQKDGTLMLVPDNKLYRPYRIDGMEVMELWEYVGHLSLDAKKA